MRGWFGGAVEEVEDEQGVEHAGDGGVEGADGLGFAEGLGVGRGLVGVLGGGGVLVEAVAVEVDEEGGGDHGLADEGPAVVLSVDDAESADEEAGGVEASQGNGEDEGLGAVAEEEVAEAGEGPGGDGGGGGPGGGGWLWGIGLG